MEHGWDANNTIGAGVSVTSTVGEMPVEQLAMIVAESDDAIVGSCPEGKILSWNPAAEKMFGYTAEEMRGRTSLRLVPDERRKKEALEIKMRVRRGERILHHETLRITKSGQLLNVNLSVYPLYEARGVLIGTSAIVRDITAQKRAEQQLRQLSWRLLHLRDEERRRMARELHDGTAQTLAALAMNLSVLNQAGDSLPARKRESLLADSLALTHTVVREVRAQSYLLHPPLLDERGLPAALRWFTDTFAARAGVEVELLIDPQIGRFSETLETAIFRVVQESLTNVQRHSGSKTARIEVGANDGWITLAIRDHGHGFSVESADVLGLGIAGMKERILELGGRFSIASTGAGTELLAVLPMTL